MINGAATADAGQLNIDGGIIPSAKSSKEGSRDLFDSMPASSNGETVRRAISTRREEELDRMEPAGAVSRFMLKWLGLNTTRRISNFVKTIGGGAFLKPVRVYPTMPASTPLVFGKKTTTVSELAASFNPRLYTINDERTQKDSLKPTETRYEMLPSKRDENHYSLLYYIKAPDEEKLLII